MLKNIKSIIKASAFVMGACFMMLSCESEADNLGSQLFEGNTASGTVKSYPVIAYNINNNDSIRTDAAKLSIATLGAFTEGQFGMQKSSFVSQVRPEYYDPDFGINAKVDSVIMILKPIYATDSLTTKTDENYIFPTGSVAAKKVTNSYPVKKYGKAKINGKTVMNIQVHQVDDFLGSNTDVVYSNRKVGYSTLLGTKSFDGTVSSIKITKDADNSELYSKEADVRIALDKTYFQNNIIAKKGQPELLNASNFIRFFKGLRISVAENDGYIMQLSPQTSVIIYYKKDVTANGVSTPTAATFTLSTGGSINAYFNEILYDRSGTPSATALAASNSTTGDEKLYTQGMGGPGVGLRIPAATVAELRDMFSKQKIGVISASIRLYTDASVWNNNYTKPDYFTVKQKDGTTFLADLTAFSASGLYSLVKGNKLNENPAYYDINITKTLKDIIETNAENKDLVLSVGNYQTDPITGLLKGINATTTPSTPNRVILVGSDAAKANKAQLNIIYSKK